MWCFVPGGGAVDVTLSGVLVLRSFLSLGALFFLRRGVGCVVGGFEVGHVIYLMVWLLFCCVLFCGCIFFVVWVGCVVRCGVWCRWCLYLV